MRASVFSKQLEKIIKNNPNIEVFVEQTETRDMTMSQTMSLIKNFKSDSINLITEPIRMNKILTSFNTFALILLFLSFVFSVFSITTLKVDETQSIKVNFYELIEIAEQPKNFLEPN